MFLLQMVMYNCPRCGYNTYQKSDMRKHFLRKNKCKPKQSDIEVDKCFNIVLGENYPKDKLQTHNFTINNPTPSIPSISTDILGPPPPQSEFTEKQEKVVNNLSFVKNKLKCSICNKSYTRKDNLLRHTKICKRVNSNNNSINNDESYSASEVEELLKQEREKTSFIIDELKNQIEVLLKNQGSNNTHTTTNYNIMVNSFGKENLDYISKDDIYNIINNGPVSSIPTLLKYIHFNPDHRENHNVKISNKKQNYAQIFNGINWEYRDKNITIDDMSDRAYKILNTHYVSGTNNYMDSFKSQYEECDKSLYKRLHRDTEIMILNSQKVK